MLTKIKLMAVKISYFFLILSDFIYKKDNYAGMRPRSMDIPSFLKLSTSKYSLVLFSMLFQCVLSTTCVFVVGSLSEILITRIKNMTLTSKKGMSHSIFTELSEIQIQQQRVQTLTARNVKNHTAEMYIFILLYKSVNVRSQRS